MLAHTHTVTFIGIEAQKIEIQVHISSGGLPAFNIVGMANKSVSESKERVRAAFASIGLGFPSKRITVNLAPADLLKDGSHFDLGIAVGLLIAMQIIPQEEAVKYLFMGELALNGSITNVNGVLPSAITAKEFNMGIICPYDNREEAVISGNDNVLAPYNLIEVVNHFSGKQRLTRAQYVDNTLEGNEKHLNLSDVKGQEQAKKALEIAAAGGHNLLMMGPPGAGKSMLAKRITGILPPLTEDEQIQASIIASIAGIIDNKNALVRNRPFREPHCSSSMPAMVGGGKDAKPGEVTLAHLGVLFLDELPEFNKQVLESLRQPIESGYITIARVNAHVTYPANFQLIAAMNPCRCGYYGSNEMLMCRKAPACAEDYQSRISGPLLDRFDMHVHVSALTPVEMGFSKYDNYSMQSTQMHDGSIVAGYESPTNSDVQVPINSESSALVLERVVAARDSQHSRCKTLGIKMIVNAQLDGELLREVAKLDDKAEKLLHAAVTRFHLSMRGINRVLRVARTIADLQQIEQCNSTVIAEALSYRWVNGI